LQSITPELARALDLPKDSGVIISDVTADSPAEAAGLHVQDVIVSVDGKPVESFFAMFCQSYMRAEGDHLRVGFLRGQEALEAEVVVGAPEPGLDRLGDDLDPQKSLIKRLGVVGLSVDERVSDLMPNLRLPFGVVVVGRSQRARMADVPLSAGDVIHAVNGTAVSTFQELDAAMSRLEPESAVALQIERGGKLMFVSFTVE
jgi:S1-C subfamily serine protease